MKAYVVRKSAYTRSFFTVYTALILLAALGLAGGVSASPLPDAKIVINIPSRTLWLYSGDEIVRYYSVGVGRAGFPTPVGRYRIIRKVSNPGWEHPYKPVGSVRIGPGGGNPLGTRWMGFKEHQGGEYGIHGTDNPGSVGKFSSHGCVRMRVKEAEALFEQVEVGTPVEVIYDTALVRRKGDMVNLVVFPDALKRGMPTVETVERQILKEFPAARVDAGAIRWALKAASQKPVTVGWVADETEALTLQPAEILEAMPLVKPVAAQEPVDAIYYKGAEGIVEPLEPTKPLYRGRMGRWAR